jgi:RNA polymerase sigma-70 factor (ECF subfamily)
MKSAWEGKRPPPEDRSDLERLQRGDLFALGNLYDRHRAKVYRTALAITRDGAMADDILQDVFLQLQRNAQRIDLDRPLEPWLYRVTVNCSYSYLRRSRTLPWPLETAVRDGVASSRGLPERRTEEREVQEAILEALECLPLNQRVVVVLHYLNDLSVGEIGEILGCPAGTVKSRLFYARDRLRHALDGEGRALLPLAYGLR